ncbi:MAG: encapsulin [Acidilobus sp.]
MTAILVVSGLLSKNPLEPVRELLTAQDAAQALRLAIIAELDAINLYNQLAQAVKDERARKVLLDVAKEEKTHFGEFLSLLRDFDPEQASELEAGSKEVSELVKSNVDPEAPQQALTPDQAIAEAARTALKALLRLRGVLPVVRVGRGVIATPRSSIAEDDVIRASHDAMPLSRLSVEFSVSQDELDYLSRLGIAPSPSAALRAASRLAAAEESLIFAALSSSAGVRTSGTWSQPGSFTRLISTALSKMTIPGPLALVVSPADKSFLASVIDQAGIDELSRASRLVDKVVSSPGVPAGSALLLSYSPDCVDVVIGADGELDFEGVYGGERRYSLWETIAVRVKVPGCVATISRSEG